MDLEHLNEFLLKHRIKRSLLAARLGVVPSWVTGLFNCTIKPTPERLLRVERTACELINEDERPSDIQRGIVRYKLHTVGENLPTMTDLELFALPFHDRLKESLVKLKEELAKMGELMNVRIENDRRPRKH
jgi:hypothetical protein